MQRWSIDGFLIITEKQATNFEEQIKIWSFLFLTWESRSVKFWIKNYARNFEIRKDIEKYSKVFICILKS